MVQSMVGAMDPYWGSLHCVGTLMVFLLTQMYKFGTGQSEQWRRGEAEITSIDVFFNLFQKTPIPDALIP